MRALSRKTAYRKSTLRNMATSLILFETIKTTTAKSKEIKPVVEHLINAAKKNDLAAKRRLLAYLFDKNAVKKVLEDLIKRYAEKDSGFIKSYKVGVRLGDGAEMTILELDKATEIKTSDEKKGKEDAKTNEETSSEASASKPVSKTTKTTK